MGQPSTTQRRVIAIAEATGLGMSTVHKYYRGKEVRESSRISIERACVELDLPTREEVKPRGEG